MGMLMTALAFGTLGFGVIFGYLSARATAALRDDPAHRPSSLCATSKEWLMTRQ